MALISSACWSTSSFGHASASVISTGRGPSQSERSNSIGMAVILRIRSVVSINQRFSPKPLRGGKHAVIGRIFRITLVVWTSAFTRLSRTFRSQVVTFVASMRRISRSCKPLRAGQAKELSDQVVLLQVRTRGFRARAAPPMDAFSPLRASYHCNRCSHEVLARQYKVRGASRPMATGGLVLGLITAALACLLPAVHRSAVAASLVAATLVLFVLLIATISALWVH